MPQNKRVRLATLFGEGDVFLRLYLMEGDVFLRLYLMEGEVGFFTLPRGG